MQQHARSTETRPQPPFPLPGAAGRPPLAHQPKVRRPITRAVKANGRSEELGSYLDDPDVQRMLRVKRGDSAAFQEIFSKHSESLLNLACRAIGNRARAEEIVQEAFLQIYRARERYEAQARFFTYACRVVTNLCINELRRLEHRLRVDPCEGRETAEESTVGDLPDDRSPLVEELVAGAELAARVDGAVSKLPERRRTALLLSRIDGLSQREVAWVLNTSESAVKSLVFRAMSTLREELHDVLPSSVAR
jgi:RNA polymerase sigma-70 factor, ECF subfamily